MQAEDAAMHKGWMRRGGGTDRAGRYGERRELEVPGAGMQQGMGAGRGCRGGKSLFTAGAHSQGIAIWCYSLVYLKAGVWLRRFPGGLRDAQTAATSARYLPASRMPKNTEDFRYPQKP